MSDEKKYPEYGEWMGEELAFQIETSLTLTDKDKELIHNLISEYQELDRQMQETLDRIQKRRSQKPSN